MHTLQPGAGQAVPGFAPMRAKGLIYNMVC